MTAYESPSAPSWRARAIRRLLGPARAERALGEWGLVRERARLAAHRRDDDFAKRNAAYLRSFADAFAGERCVIIGNGPSLNETNLSLLRHEATFGLNRIYLKFPEMGFRTTFHVVVNQLVVEQCGSELAALDAPLFTTWPSREHLERRDAIAFLDSLPEPAHRPRFSRRADVGVWEGATVTYVAMQLAYYMGFREVILVGVDHRFAVEGKPHTVVVSESADASHFDPAYFGPGFRWQLPDLETSEYAFRLARREFERAGRRVLDATVGGALEVFPKVDLAEALGK